jgi:hypothetical protein
MRGRKVIQWGLHALGLSTAAQLCPAAAWACAVCWGADDALARAMDTSVLFLMSMPCLI